MSNPRFRPLTHVDGAGHERPGYDGFSGFTLDVLSAELPCGVSWLASLFLELDVPVWNPWNVDMTREWQHLGGHAYRYDYPGDPWSRVMPGLVTGRRFDFSNAIVPRFSHDLPGQWTPCDRQIIFVRDPRDALFSAWRRMQRPGNKTPSFFDWVREADARWQIDRISAYLLHIALWWGFSALRGNEALIVRFEDVKADAAREFRRIQTFINEPALSPTHENLQRALRVASFENLQYIEDKFVASGVFDHRVNRAGVAFEYKSHFMQAHHDALGSAGAQIYRDFGYELPVARNSYVNYWTAEPPWVQNVRTDLKTDVRTALANAEARFRNVVVG